MAFTFWKNSSMNFFVVSVLWQNRRGTKQNRTEKTQQFWCRAVRKPYFALWSNYVVIAFWANDDKSNDAMEEQLRLATSGTVPTLSCAFSDCIFSSPFYQFTTKRCFYSWIIISVARWHNLFLKSILLINYWEYNNDDDDRHTRIRCEPYWWQRVHSAHAHR